MPSVCLDGQVFKPEPALNDLTRGYRGVSKVEAGREVGWLSGHERHTSPERDRPTRLRVSVAGVAGVVVALTGASVGWQYAAAAG